MDLFSIIGPVMVGPSSSHTAGVVRIGNVVCRLFGGVPERVTVRFHGSFAGTWRGHGSDKAIIAGILGFAPDDERIRDSLAYGAQAGLQFAFETADLPQAHPNTVEVVGEARGVTAVVRGESVGGGNIIIRRINDIEMEFDGRYDTLIVSHIDQRGVIAYVAGVLAHEDINIARMMDYRSNKGGDALMVIECDGTIDKRLETALQSARHINSARVIEKLN